MDQYEKHEKLGEGAHGIVIKARVRTRDEVAQLRRLAREQEQQELNELEHAAAAPSVQNTPKKRKLEQEANAAAAAAEATEDALEDIQLHAPENSIVAIKKIRLKSASEGLSMEAVR
jgi:uncharacterized membrane protein